MAALGNVRKHIKLQGQPMGIDPIWENAFIPDQLYIAVRNNGDIIGGRI